MNIESNNKFKVLTQELGQSGDLEGFCYPTVITASEGETLRVGDILATQKSCCIILVVYGVATSEDIGSKKFFNGETYTGYRNLKNYKKVDNNKNLASELYNEYENKNNNQSKGVKTMNNLYNGAVVMTTVDGGQRAGVISNGGRSVSIYSDASKQFESVKANEFTIKDYNLDDVQPLEVEVTDIKDLKPHDLVIIDEVIGNFLSLANDSTAVKIRTLSNAVFTIDIEATRGDNNELLPRAIGKFVQPQAVTETTEEERRQKLADIFGVGVAEATQKPIEETEKTDIDKLAEALAKLTSSKKD